MLTDSVGHVRSLLVTRHDPSTRLRELVRCATAVFIEQGYKGAQMEDVARALGVAKGTPYVYVESKEALFDLDADIDQPRLRVEVDSGPIIDIPASALTKFDDQPAVWIVDPAKNTVSLRNIEVLRYDPARVAVSGGLTTGEVVVTAGVQALHPGQQVRLLGSEP